MNTYAVSANPKSLCHLAGDLSDKLAKLVDRICIALLIVLILDVWLGILVRYFIPLPITFTEELARYLMIWTALLAVSSGIAHREHIGVLFVFDKLPEKLKRPLLALMDLIGIGFFLILLYYGLSFTAEGANQLTMIYGINKAIPFSAVPVATALAAIQLLLVSIRDQGASRVEPAKSDVEGEE